jgi:hypothetical protein
LRSRDTARDQQSQQQRSSHHPDACQEHDDLPFFDGRV